jgi:hypothetical protein
MPNLKLSVFVFFILTGKLFCQKINVYDTLLSHHLFTHIETEKRKDYFLDKNGNLLRKVFLSSEILHYHKSHEDSIYHFLKSIYDEKFNSLIFEAGEDIKWETDGVEVFEWKKGEKIDKSKLDRVFASLTEININLRRPAFLIEEEKNHFFYYHNYLLDSLKKTIYCYNRKKGKCNGKIVYNVSGIIENEKGFFPNRTSFYDFDGANLIIYSKPGQKRFLINFDTVSLYEKESELKQLFKKKGNTKKDEQLKKIYYKEINELWRKFSGG